MTYKENWLYKTLQDNSVRERMLFDSTQLVGWPIPLVLLFKKKSVLKLMDRTVCASQKQGETFRYYSINYNIYSFLSQQLGEILLFVTSLKYIL